MPPPNLTDLMELAWMAAEQAKTALETCRELNFVAELFWLRSSLSDHWMTRWLWQV